jgi:6-phosphofructokinase 2
MLLAATVTSHPAVDLSTTVERLLESHKLRCSAPLVHPGGGGVNVARVLHRFGHEVLACLPTGGTTGARLARMLAAEGVPTHCVPVAADTRENITVVERATGREYRFVLPGEPLAPTEWQALQDALPAVPPPWLVASGGLAPGVPADGYARLIRTTRKRRPDLRVVLDAAGAPLAAALREGVEVVKPSLRELRDLAGAELQSSDEQLEAARNLVRAGQARLVALTLGAEGALLVGAQQALRAQPLDVPVLGTVGAGDCFLAGLVDALARAEDLPAALAQAVAAGTAALLQPGTALCQPQDVARLRPQVRITALD